MSSLLVNRLICVVPVSFFCTLTADTSCLTGSGGPGGPNERQPFSNCGNRELETGLGLGCSSSTTATNLRCGAMSGMCRT